MTSLHNFNFIRRLLFRIHKLGLYIVVRSDKVLLYPWKSSEQCAHHAVWY